jgi:hypothetical protein
VFEYIGVVAGVEGVTVIHGNSWKAAEFSKSGGDYQIAAAMKESVVMLQRKKYPVKPSQKPGLNIPRNQEGDQTIESAFKPGQFAVSSDH